MISQKIIACISLALFFVFYFNPNLSCFFSNLPPIPSVSFLIFLPLSVFLKARINYFAWFVTFYIVLLFSVLAILFDTGSVTETIKSLFIFSYVSLSSFAIYAIFRKLGPSEINRVGVILLSISLLFISYALLENELRPLQYLSNGFRQWFYGTSPNDSINREMLMLGRIRPRAFSLEPGIASAGLCTALSIVFLILKNLKVRLLVLFLCPVISFAYGSPVSSVFFVALFACLIIEYKNNIYVKPVHVLSLIILGGIASYLLGAVVQERIDRFISGQDESFNERILLPYQLLKSTLETNPYLGLGLGQESEVNLNMDQFRTLDGKSANRMINAPIFAIGIYFGFSGFIYCTILSLILITKIGAVNFTIFLLMITPNLLSGGNIHTTIAWISSGIIIAMLGLNKSRSIIT